MRIKNVIVMLMTSMMLICMSCINILALDTSDIDMSKSGSITVTLTADNGETVTDGKLTLYQVADLDNDFSYQYTSDFINCNIVLDDLSDSDLGSEFLSYVESNDIDGVTISVDENGEVAFLNLDLGLYLIVQTVSADGYSDIQPVMVSVPLEDSDTWIYDVDASPKIEVMTTVETPSTPTPDTTTSLPQTGMQIAPMAITAFTGLLIFAIGWKLRYGRKKD